jgi:hypothetical protein
LAGVPTEIRTEHLPNKSQDHHPYAKSLCFNSGSFLTVRYVLVSTNTDRIKILFSSL